MRLGGGVHVEAVAVFMTEYIFKISYKSVIIKHKTPIKRIWQLCLPDAILKFMCFLSASKNIANIMMMLVIKINSLMITQSKAV